MLFLDAFQICANKSNHASWSVDGMPRGSSESEKGIDCQLDKSVGCLNQHWQEMFLLVQMEP